MFTTNPGDKYSSYCRIANGKVEDWKGSVTCSRSHSEGGRSEIQTQAVRLCPEVALATGHLPVLATGLLLLWGRRKTPPLPFLVLMAGPIIKIT